MLPSQAARAGLRASTHQFTSLRRSVALDGIRTYAVAAQNVKPPVALYGIDGTYANALVRVAVAGTAYIPDYSKAKNDLYTPSDKYSFTCLYSTPPPQKSLPSNRPPGL